jgi:tagaturonate reductase
MRVVPDLLHYYKRFNAVPQYVALGFAAYLLFMRGTRQEGTTWHGEANGQEYVIQDEQAGYFASLWQQNGTKEVVMKALSNQDLWHADLTTLPGFAESVTNYLLQIQQEGAAATLAATLNKTQKTPALS